MTQSEATTARDEVLNKAFLRAANNLGLSGADIEKITGFSEASISRMKNGSLPSDKKSREILLIFLRMYGSLIHLAGDAENAKEWFYSDNSDLGGVPFELAQTLMGLADVTNYLDTMGGKLWAHSLEG
ncbi:MAG: antitoxin Xre/MbcA/ParS toxin-binding domain-containing protein [Pseudomonadota bacterium]